MPLQAPLNVTPPVISGAPWPGRALVMHQGEWSGWPMFARQWRRGATNIPGATGAVYHCAVADIGQAVTVAVIAQNVTGASPAAISAAVGPVAYP
jgi:hypothetical protein